MTKQELLILVHNHHTVLLHYLDRAQEAVSESEENDIGFYLGEIAAKASLISSEIHNF